MSKWTILNDGKGTTKEACLAALIVGALIHEGYIEIDKNPSIADGALIAQIRLVARLLQGNLREDQPVFPVDY